MLGTLYPIEHSRSLSNLYLKNLCFFCRKSQVKKQQWRFNYITRRCIISAAYYNPSRNISEEIELL